MSMEEHDMCKMDIKQNIFFETIYINFDDAMQFFIYKLVKII